MSARAVATCVCLLMGLAAGAALPQDARAVHLGLGAERRREECHNRRHRKTTLKLIKEQPFAGLFRTLKNSSTALKFEASGGSRCVGTGAADWPAAGGAAGRRRRAPPPRPPARHDCARRRRRPCRSPAPPCTPPLAPRGPPGLARVRGEYWVVFDNAMAIGHMDDVFRFR